LALTSQINQGVLNMATTMRIQNRQIKLSIEDKARLLQVIDIGEPGLFAVRSGSDANTAYGVRHDGKHATYCPCRAVGRCAHKQAVDWKLEADRRDAYCREFQIYGE